MDGTIGHRWLLCGLLALPGNYYCLHSFFHSWFSLSLIFWPLSTPIRFTVSFTTFDPTKITSQMGNNSLFHPIWWCSCLKIRFSNNGNMSKWSKGWGQLQIPIYKTGLGGSLLQEVYFWKVLTCLVIVCKLILCLTCKDDLGVLHLARYLVISFSVRMYSHCVFILEAVTKTVCIDHISIICKWRVECLIARLIKHKHGHLIRPRGQTKETGTMTTDQGAKRQSVGLGSLKIKRHYDQIPSVNVVIHSLSSFLKHTHNGLCKGRAQWVSLSWVT